MVTAYVRALGQLLDPRIIRLIGYTVLLSLLVFAAFFLFPVVISTLLGLFLDAVARAVELRHYAELPPAKGVGLFAGLLATLRFLLKALVLNVVLLVCLFVPILLPLYPFAWFATHAYLLGREYFEMVAMRRLDVRSARELRRRHWLSVLAGGLAAVGLFAIPVVNLIAPVVVTMAMVHACERWRQPLQPAQPLQPVQRAQSVQP